MCNAETRGWSRIVATNIDANQGYNNIERIVHKMVNTRWTPFGEQILDTI